MHKKENEHIHKEIIQGYLLLVPTGNWSKFLLWNWAHSLIERHSWGCWRHQGERHGDSWDTELLFHSWPLPLCSFADVGLFHSGNLKNEQKYIDNKGKVLFSPQDISVMDFRSYLKVQISLHRLITMQSTSKYLIFISTAALFATCNWRSDNQIQPLAIGGGNPEAKWRKQNSDWRQYRLASVSYMYLPRRDSIS